MNDVYVSVSGMGVFGSSQGAWVNSLVYDQTPSLNYIIMASGGVASTGLESYYDAITDNPNLSVEEATNILVAYDGILGYDPFSTLESIALPTLWIYGSEDRSHPARYDIMILEGLQKSNFTINAYTNTNHELNDIDTQQPPTTLFSDIGSWLMGNN